MNSRWLILFLAVLLIPGALVAVWAGLRFGGSIEGQERLEAQRGREALDELERGFWQQLRGVRVEPEAPLRAFVGAELSSAGRIGLEFEAEGDPRQALAYFARARQPLDLRVGLAKARALLALERVAEARALLEGLEVAGIALAGVPAELSVAVLRARAGQLEAVWRELLAGALPVPAHLADMVVEQLGPLGEGPGQERIDDFLWQSRAEQALDLGLVDRGGVREVFPDGGVWLGDRQELVAPRVVRAQLATQRVEIAARYGLEIPAAGAKVDSPLAQKVLAGVPLVVDLPSGARGSARLRWTANVCLALALATFLLGNLVLLWITRRTAALSRLKSDFIDVVSHELRTPLTALSVKAEMLAAGDVPEGKQGVYQRKLYEDVDRLSGLVHDVLDFGRLERGRYRLSPERVPARVLVAHAVRASRDALRMGRQRLRVEVPRHLPELWVDVEVCVRALRNLIDNATKHAPPASAIALAAVAGTGERIRFTVEDEGPGLGGADPRDLFEPFRRGKSRQQGSGLGLAIVDRAARVHGGRASAAERSGGGAVFAIELPTGGRP